MNNRPLQLVGGVLLVVLLASAALLFGKSNPTKTSNQGPSGEAMVSEPTSTPPPTPTPQPFRLILFDDTGFVPDEIRVKVGARVMFMNQSSGVLDVASDEHPTRRLYPILNLGIVAKGTGADVTFDQVGTYTYHNHVMPEQTGKIIVE